MGLKIESKKVGVFGNVNHCSTLALPAMFSFWSMLTRDAACITLILPLQFFKYILSEDYISL